MQREHIEGTEFVCSDVGYDGLWDGDWLYYPSEFMYRRMKNGEMRGRISVKNMQDPNLKWDARIKMSPDLPVEALKPTAATFKLWEHKQRVSSN